MKNITNILTLGVFVFSGAALFSVCDFEKENTPQAQVCKDTIQYPKSDRLYQKAENKQGVEFVEACEKLAKKLEVPTSWLLAVMHHESKFSHTVANYAGSKAVGLIQFMPTTAKGLGTTTKELASLTAVEQLKYVETYLMQEKKVHGGFFSCGDLYFAVFYPKYRKDVKSRNFAKVIGKYPKKTYTQNSGMDYNKDKVLTVGDICTYFYSTNKELY